MKRLLLVLAFVLGTLGSFAQFDTLAVKNKISVSVDSMSFAFRENRWTDYARYMNDGLLEVFGDSAGFAMAMDTIMKKLYEQAELQQYYAGKILQVVKTPKGYQCVTESFIQMTFSGMMLSGVSYNVGASPDGENWKFLRVDEDSRLKIEDFIPDISAQIRIPEDQMETGLTLEEFLKTYKVIYKKTPVPVKKPAPKKTGKTAKPKKVT